MGPWLGLVPFRITKILFELHCEASALMARWQLPDPPALRRKPGSKRSGFSGSSELLQSFPVMPGHAARVHRDPAPSCGELLAQTLQSFGAAAASGCQLWALCIKCRSKIGVKLGLSSTAGFVLSTPVL